MGTSGLEQLWFAFKDFIGNADSMLYAFLGFLLVIWAILWILVPFMIYYLMSYQGEALKVLKQVNHKLDHMDHLSKDTAAIRQQTDIRNMK